MKIIQYISQLVIPLFILLTLLYGTVKRIRIYDSFIYGAKESIELILRIFPYILAIFVAIKSFQSSGAFDFVKSLFSAVFDFFSVPQEVIAMSLIKPLSGSASLAIFTDIVKTTGADSLATKISAVIMGSAETTFYVLAVYLGAVNIRKTKYLVPVCVISDIIGIVVAIIVVKLLL